MLEVFAAQNVRMMGLSIVDSADWAVIRTVFSDSDKARELLKRHPLPFTESNVMLALLSDEEALSELCGYLLRAEINIHFAYPLTIQRQNHPVMVFHVDELSLAIRTLQKHGFTILGHEDLTEPS